MKTFTDLGTEIGALVEQKNAAYGSSFAVAGDFLRLLFPDGVPADRYDDALLLVRIFDKQMRIATDKDAFGESPYQDIAGYGILGLHLHQQKDSKTWPGSASAPDASSSSKARLTSAAQPTGAKTTTSASETAANGPSLPHFASYGKPTSAPAPTATVPASVNADARIKEDRRNNLSHTSERWLSRHDAVRCIACESHLSGIHFYIPLRIDGGLIQLAVCSYSCAGFCENLMRGARVKGASLP